MKWRLLRNGRSRNAKYGSIIEYTRYLIESSLVRTETMKLEPSLFSRDWLPRKICALRYQYYMHDMRYPERFFVTTTTITLKLSILE